MPVPFSTTGELMDRLNLNRNSVYSLREKLQLGSLVAGEWYFHPSEVQLLVEAMQTTPLKERIRQRRLGRKPEVRQRNALITSLWQMGYTRTEIVERVGCTQDAVSQLLGSLKKEQAAAAIREAIASESSPAVWTHSPAETPCQ